MPVKKNKRAQSSFEFISIVGILFLVVLGAIGLIQAKANSILKDRNDVLVSSINNLVTTEVKMAASVNGQYYRQFDMPYFIEGNNYTITRSGSSDFEIKIEDSRYILFLNYNTSGNFVRGSNFIRKTDALILINS